MMWSKNQAVCAIRWQKPAVRAERSYRAVEGQPESLLPTRLASHSALRLCFARANNNLPFPSICRY
jgi:hypothetical protein